MDQFLERLAITGILIMLVILIVFPVLLFVFFRGKNEKNIGTNMNNETKEYVRVIDNSYGVTADGTRELLKSYKYKK